MKYVLINPVADSMYDREKLDEVLALNGYTRVECSGSWGTVVRDKYGELASEKQETIVDVRCPVAAQKVKEEYKEDGLYIPDIEPILLHCAREISGREDLKTFEKIITTPCKALADKGNELHLENTLFMAWNEFEAILSGDLKPELLEASPIPPGFFTELDTVTDSITGEEVFHNYFKNKEWKDKGLVEILFCEQGCHNGDGVTCNA